MKHRHDLTPSKVHGDKRAGRFLGGEPGDRCALYGRACPQVGSLWMLLGTRSCLCHLWTEGYSLGDILCCVLDFL